MSTAHVVVSVLLAVALTASATLNFARYQRVLINMAKFELLPVATLVSGLAS